MTKTKTKASTIALLLALTITLTLVALPTANAHTPAWQIPTFAYINVAPNPIGVGQTAAVIMWLDKIPDGAAIGNDRRFHDYKLTITKPDGTTEVKTWDVVIDTTSSQYYAYIPTEVGEYKFKFEFPGQTYTWTDPISGFFGPPAPSAYINDTYLASSAETALTVQEEPISWIGSYPLPTEYWARPIYGENTDWWSVSSEWFGSGSPQFTSQGFTTSTYVPDGVGSKTSHVMWTKVLEAGGVVGGDNLNLRGDTYFEGSAYINRYTNPIIMNGKIYYNDPLSFSGGNTGPLRCVDLRTGELIWSSDTIGTPSFGFIYAVHNPNQHGVVAPILVVASGGASFFGPATPLTWMGYDADTGKQLFNATGVPSGSKAMGSEGEFIQYVITNTGNTTNPNYVLGEWNSSKLASAGMLAESQISGVVNGSTSTRYNWQVPISWRNTIPSMTVVKAWYGDKMLCYRGSLPGLGPFASGSFAPYTYFAVNLNASTGTVGSVLWENTLNAPPGNVTVIVAGFDQLTGVFVESHKQTRQWVGYSLETGQKLWGPVGDQPAFDYYGSDFGGGVVGNVAYGKLYYSGFAGILYCYDAYTGNLLWTYGNGGEGNSTNSGLTTGQTNYPTYITAIADGVIYLETTEHTIPTPIYKGAKTRAVNATDGTELWTLSAYTGGGGSTTSYAVADGYTNFFNGYDNQIYVLGKGPTSMTVEAPKAAIEMGKSLIISGTVTDVSAGVTQDEQALKFPNGVPAMSDASMTKWMGYVYQQKPRPTDVTGVKVTLSVLDSNNNYRDIGTTTSNSDGFFAFNWTPDIEGQYTVYASFAGSNAYWPSHAVTAFAVDPAPEEPAEITIPADNSGTYVTYSTVAIIAAIAVVGVVLALLMRKR